MFNSVTTGGSDDFSRASRIAYEMVTRYGMGRMGLVSYSSDQETFQK
jgi:ATP-dependent Zn protease